MADPELRHVDPYAVNVDEMNERRENLQLAELEKSVAEQGVIQPPLVRKRNGEAEVPYTVVVGQRRVMAAQGVGLESIPVVVVGWDDAEALEKSISENIDAFKKEVSDEDRARAIDRLKELTGWGNSSVADSLGVSVSTVQRWLEPLKWDKTPLTSSQSPSNSNPDGNSGSTGKTDRESNSGSTGKTDRESNSGSESTDNLSTDDFPIHTLQTVRRLAGSPDVGVRLLEVIDEAGLRKDQVNEVKSRVDARYAEPSLSEIEDIILEVEAEAAGDPDKRIYIDFTATDAFAEAIDTAGKDRGMSNREVVKTATRAWLESEGYL